MKRVTVREGERAVKVCRCAEHNVLATEGEVVDEYECW
jgi:hypothetical protein